MRILIVTAHFPPKNAIPSFRLYSFAYNWFKAGHNITVLTTSHNKNDNDLDFDCSIFNVLRSPVPYFSGLLSFSSNLDQNTKNQNIKKNALYNILRFFKKMYMSISDNAQRFPSFFDLWANKAVKLVNALDYDVVLSSGGPYSVHRIGLFLKKRNKKIKWIVDWRDLWTPPFKGFVLFKRYQINLERTFHKNADLITCVSELCSKITSSMTATPVKTVYNGFMPNDSVKNTNSVYKNNDKFTIVYTGNFYRNVQDPSPFLKAVSRIKKKNIDLYNKLEILFAGKNSDLIDLFRKNDISECYNFIGFIKYEDSLSLQYNSDAVLFIDFADETISGKMFEYMYYPKKIMAVGYNANSIAAEFIKMSNAGVYLGSDIDLIENYLIENIQDPKKYEYEKNYSFINQFTRENQAARMLDNILQLN